MSNISSSAERDPLENFCSNITNRTFECEELRKENKELRKKLKKTRKKKKRWKKKYLKLYNYVKMMEDTTYITTKDPTIDRIEAGLGIPPIKPLEV